MITGSIAVFPNNIVFLMSSILETLDTDIPVHKRRLYSTDEIQAVGVTAFMWTPDRQSYEMRGEPYSGVPTISQYDITVQCMIRNMDENEGMRQHAELTTLVTRTVMGNSALRSSLLGLTSTLYGVTERLKKWHIENSRFLAEEVSGEFVYLSTSTVRFETET